MAKFVLMLRDQGTFGADMSPADIQAVIEKYIAWGEGLRQRGQLHLGEKLRDGEGRVLRPTPGAPTVSDGPFAEAREVIGGFYIISADDYAAAVAIARTCPHMDIGSIEVRLIEEM